MTTTINTFDQARTMILEEGFSMALMLMAEDVDAMSEPDWLALREEARDYGLTLEIDDDGDAVARAR